MTGSKSRNYQAAPLWPAPGKRWVVMYDHTCTEAVHYLSDTSMQWGGERASGWTVSNARDAVSSRASELHWGEQSAAER